MGSVATTRKNIVVDLVTENQQKSNYFSATNIALY